MCGVLVVIIGRNMGDDVLVQSVHKCAGTHCVMTGVQMCWNTLCHDWCANVLEHTVSCTNLLYHDWCMYMY